MDRASNREQEGSPALSVVLPTYNRARFLRRSIGSVLAQSFRDLELIVVDDASTDETPEVVRGIDDARIRYTRCPENRGGAAARNVGISAARGRYVAFQDSDDEWLPEKLRKQMDLFAGAAPEIGMVFCGTRVLVERGDGSTSRVGESIPERMEEFPRSVLRGVPSGCSLQGLVVRAELLHEIEGFDGALPSQQDWDLFIRLSRRCRATAVPEVLVVWHRGHGPSITRNLQALISGRERVLEKHGDLMKDDREGLLRQYRDLARFCLLAAEREKAGYYLRQAGRVGAARDRLALLPLWLLLLIGNPAVQKLRSLRGRLRARAG